MTGQAQITFEEAVSSFFMNPAEQPPHAAPLGILYLLRRDIRQCMAQGVPLLLPATMLVLAGIDLLGKFLTGSDSTGPGAVGERFRRFVREYMALGSEDQVDALYQLRNTLMHSFGLYCRVRDSKGNIKKEYVFLLRSGASDAQTVIVQRGDSQYSISVKSVLARFESAVETYRTALSTNLELQSHFRAIYPWYGTTGMVIADRPMSLDDALAQLGR